MIGIRFILLVFVAITTLVRPVAAGLVSAIEALPVTDASIKALVVSAGKIGNLPPLSNATNDAQAFGELLEDLGHQVTILHDPSSVELATAADALRASLRSNDVALFYFSGHGFDVQNQLFLIVSDGCLAQDNYDQCSSQDAVDSSVNALEFSSDLGIEDTRFVGIFDTDRRNPFRDENIVVQQHRWQKEDSMLVFGTVPGGVALDSSFGPYGLFTASLLSLIRIDPTRDFSDILRDVRRFVVLRSSQQQIPFVADSLFEPFRISSRKNPEPSRIAALERHTAAMQQSATTQSNQTSAPERARIPEPRSEQDTAWSERSKRVTDNVGLGTGTGTGTGTGLNSGWGSTGSKTPTTAIAIGKPQRELATGRPKPAHNAISPSISRKLEGHLAFEALGNPPETRELLNWLATYESEKELTALVEVAYTQLHIRFEARIDSSTPAAPLAKMNSAKSMVSRTANSVISPNNFVYLECKTQQGKTVVGSGVIVSERGHVLTAKHVANPEYECLGRRGTSARIPDRRLVHRAEAQRDAALLQFLGEDGEIFEPVPFQIVDRALQGKQVRAYGFPANTMGEVSARQGVLSTTFPDENGLIQSDVITAPGMSGGPVFLDSKLIGIVAGANFTDIGTVSDYGILSAEFFAKEFDLIGAR